MIAAITNIVIIKLIGKYNLVLKDQDVQEARHTWSVSVTNIRLNTGVSGYSMWVCGKVIRHDRETSNPCNRK